MIWTILTFAAGFYAGHYFSPWVDAKISDMMGEQD